VNSEIVIDIMIDTIAPVLQKMVEDLCKYSEQWWYISIMF